MSSRRRSWLGGAATISAVAAVVWMGHGQPIGSQAIYGGALAGLLHLEPEPLALPMAEPVEE